MTQTLNQHSLTDYPVIDISRHTVATESWKAEWTSAFMTLSPKCGKTPKERRGPLTKSFSACRAYATRSGVT